MTHVIIGVVTGIGVLFIILLVAVLVHRGRRNFRNFIKDTKNLPEHMVSTTKYFKVVQKGFTSSDVQTR